MRRGETAENSARKSLKTSLRSGKRRRRAAKRIEPGARTSRRRPLQSARRRRRTAPRRRPWFVSAANLETRPALAPRPPRSRRRPGALRQRRSGARRRRGRLPVDAAGARSPRPRRRGRRLSLDPAGLPRRRRPPAVAIRSMSVGGEPLLLIADPDKLTTRIERAACWTCADADEASLASTRMMRAIEESAAGARPHPSRFPAQRRPRPRRRAGRLRHRRPLSEPQAARARLPRKARRARAAYAGRAVDLRTVAAPSLRRLSLARRPAGERRARHPVGQPHLPSPLRARRARRA